MLKFRPLLSGALRASVRTSCATHTSDVSLKVSPKTCLYDEASNITVKGLEPGALITLKSSVNVGPKQREFVSHAHYVVDGKGEVNTSQDFSVGGSYEGVFPMGLLSTLRPALEAYKYARYLKVDASTPDTVNVSLYKDHLPIEAHFAENKSSRPEAIASCEMERLAMAPGVRRIPVRQGRIRGTLFLPSGPGPFPGVIDTYGGLGGLVEIRAALLASRGIAAFALALFKFEDLPKSFWRIELEYIEEAVEYLLNQPSVIPDRCGFVSVSQSAPSALACGAWMDKVKAVVTIGGFPFFFECHLTYKDREYFGERYDPRHMHFNKGGDKVFLDEGLFASKLHSEYPLTVPIEEADDDTYFLSIGGDKDALGLNRGLEVLQKRLATRGRSDKIRTILYPGVGHLLEVPYVAHTGFLWQDFSPVMAKRIGRKGAAMYYGCDQPQLYSLAQVHHWSEIRNFISYHIQDQSPWYQNYIHEQRAYSLNTL